MNFEAKIITKTSKAGNQYEVLLLQYKDFIKEVYLNKTEVQLLNLMNKDDNKKEFPELF